MGDYPASCLPLSVDIKRLYELASRFFGVVLHHRLRRYDHIHELLNRISEQCEGVKQFSYLLVCSQFSCRYILYLQRYGYTNNLIGMRFLEFKKCVLLWNIRKQIPTQNNWHLHPKIQDTPPAWTCKLHVQLKLITSIQTPLKKNIWN